MKCETTPLKVQFVRKVFFFCLIPNSLKYWRFGMFGRVERHPDVSVFDELGDKNARKTNRGRVSGIHPQLRRDGLNQMSWQLMWSLLRYFHLNQMRRTEDHQPSCDVCANWVTVTAKSLDGANRRHILIVQNWQAFFSAFHFRAVGVRLGCLPLI